MSPTHALRWPCSRRTSEHLGDHYGNLEAQRPVPGTRPCVHCFRRHRAPPGVPVVCPACREIEAALNGGPRPAVQVAFGVTRPRGLQPWWTPAEDRVLAQCATAAEAHGRLPWRSKTACNYRFKTLRRAGRVRAFNHREWSPAEDHAVANATSPSEIPTIAREFAVKVLCGEDTPILTRPAGSQRSGGSRAARRRSASGGCPMWPRRRNRAVSAAILLLFHAFAGGHAKRGHDGLGGP